MITWATATMPTVKGQTRTTTMASAYAKDNGLANNAKKTTIANTTLVTSNKTTRPQVAALFRPRSRPQRRNDGSPGSRYTMAHNMAASGATTALMTNVVKSHKTPSDSVTLSSPSPMKNTTNWMAKTTSWTSSSAGSRAIAMLKAALPLPRCR